jgi:hypothetical protein
MLRMISNSFQFSPGSRKEGSEKALSSIGIVGALKAGWRWFSLRSKDAIFLAG